jgi:hypothetical protein
MERDLVEETVEYFFPLKKLAHKYTETERESHQ